MSELSPYEGLHAVIAEDSQHMRTLLRSMLRALGFGQVMAESNGADALRQIELSLPDVVLLDWNMPGISGIDVVNVLRSMPAPICHVPTMIVTAHASAARLKEAKSLGVNSFLCKPVSITSLDARLQQIISQSHVYSDERMSHQIWKKTKPKPVPGQPPGQSRLICDDEEDTDLETFYV